MDVQAKEYGTTANRLPRSFFEQFELKVIAGFALTSAVLLLLLLVGDWVWDGSLYGFERWVLLRLGAVADALSSRSFEEIIRDFTALGGMGVISVVTLIASCYLALKRGGRQFAIFIGIMVSGMVLSWLLKLAVGRPRPDVVVPAIYVATASFPSGHSMLSALAYLTLGAMVARLEARKALKILWLTTGIGMVVLIGLTRLYLGVHWPTDVLVGWLLGSGWAILGLWLENQFGGNLPSPTAAKRGAAC